MAAALFSQGHTVGATPTPAPLEQADLGKWGREETRAVPRDNRTSAALSDTGFAQYGKWVWEMRRRRAAVAIMLRIKEGLGSEAPSAPSCTSSLAAAAPSCMKWV